MQIDRDLRLLVEPVIRANFKSHKFVCPVSHQKQLLGNTSGTPVHPLTTENPQTAAIHQRHSFAHFTKRN